MVPENSVPSPEVVAVSEGAARRIRRARPAEQAEHGQDSGTSAVRLRCMWFPLRLVAESHGATTWIVPVMPAVAVPWIEQ